MSANLTPAFLELLCGQQRVGCKPPVKLSSLAPLQACVVPSAFAHSVGCVLLCRIFVFWGIDTGPVDCLDGL